MFTCMNNKTAEEVVVEWFTLRVRYRTKRFGCCKEEPSAHVYHTDMEELKLQLWFEKSGPGQNHGQRHTAALKPKSKSAVSLCPFLSIHVVFA